MARANEPDMPPKHIKNVRLGMSILCVYIYILRTSHLVDDCLDNRHAD